jgi:hypothetical protein
LTNWSSREACFIENFVNIGEIQYIVPMASDLLALSDASALLGVSSERVRQLIVAGDLPGVRFGNAPLAMLICRMSVGIGTGERCIATR